MIVRTVLSQFLPPHPPFRTFAGFTPRIAIDSAVPAPLVSNTEIRTVPINPLYSWSSKILNKGIDNNIDCLCYHHPMPKSCIDASSNAALATIKTAWCWSLLFLVLFKNNIRTSRVGANPKFHQSHGWMHKLLGTSLLIPKTTTMSSYSILFADAFHPSAAYVSKETTEDENDIGDQTQTPKHSEGSCEANSMSSENKEETCLRNKIIIPNGTPHPEDDKLMLFHFESTPSTQDEAKKIAHHFSALASTSLASSIPKTFCVTATSQSNGRGTTGRQWMGAPGNVFVTIGIPTETYMTSMLRDRKIPLTLLPLKIGDLTALLIQHELLSKKETPTNEELPGVVTVKWPNDVLVDGKKISGTLIESSNDWFLIGIGINVAHAPSVPSKGNNYGRPSTSLSDYGSCKDCFAPDLGIRLAHEFHQWVYPESTSQKQSDTEGTAEGIVQRWKGWLDWDADLTMRNDSEKLQRKRVVRLLDVLPDGRIRVQDKDNGKEEILVSDYFV